MGVLNTELVRDTVPFTKYMESFEKCHAVIIQSIVSFIQQLDAVNNPKKAGKSESDEDMIRNLEQIIASQWMEFESMLFEYIEDKASSSNVLRSSQIISTKGALTMQALRFAVNNLMSSL